MSLVALDYLDANRFTMGKYVKEAKERMSLKEFGDEQIKKEITPLLDRGVPDLELSWRHYIEEQLEEHAPREILNDLFPLLVTGIATGAFHPLIRLSYALETHNQEEFVAAMAYWASHYEELNNKTSEIIIPADLKEILIDATDANFANPIVAQGNTIFHKMKSVSLSTEFNKNSYILEMDFDDYIDQSSLYAAYLFNRDFDFTLLHVTSSTMALRLIGDYLTKENKGLAVRHHFHAFRCAHYVAGAPRVTTPMTNTNTPEIEWKTLNKQAVQTLDDHVLKVTYLCLKEAQHYKRPFYKSLAKGYIEHHTKPKP